MASASNNELVLKSIENKKNMTWAQTLVIAEINYQNLKDEVSQHQTCVGVAEKYLREATDALAKLDQSANEEDKDYSHQTTLKQNVAFWKGKLHQVSIMYSECLEKQIDCLRVHHQIDLELMQDELRKVEKKIKNTEMLKNATDPFTEDLFEFMAQM